MDKTTNQLLFDLIPLINDFMGLFILGEFLHTSLSIVELTIHYSHCPIFHVENKSSIGSCSHGIPVVLGIS